MAMLTPAELRSIALFDGLDDAQLAQLVAAGEEIRFIAGQELFQEARPAVHWWVLLAGKVDLLRTVGHEETVLGHMERPGQWAGGFQAWDSSGVYLATARTGDVGRMLRVPAESLRDLASAWFPFGVHFISGLVNTVRNIESMARQREALVALGTLAAGLAHEINNPASAATRAVDALQETAATLLSSLGRLAQGSITAAQFVELDRLRQSIPPVTTKLKPLKLADREDAIADWLADHGVEDGWRIAPALAAGGLDPPWCDRAAEILDGPALASGLEWVASSLATGSLLAEIKESTGRISELVAAVKSYSHMDRASLQRTDITEGLNSTLVMLGHKFGDGIAVVRK